MIDLYNRIYIENIKTYKLKCDSSNFKSNSKPTDLKFSKEIIIRIIMKCNQLKILLED